MKNKILLLAGILLMAFSACNRSDKKVEALKHAIDVAEYQLKQSAAEFDTTQLFPRSWKADKFRAVDAYDWTSGFFPGSLWIGYQLTGDEALKSEAEKYTARLHEIPAYKGTHDLGFMVFCSYGMQQAIENDEVSAAAIVEASNSLSSRFCDSVGLIRSWDFGPWNYPVIIDNMMNLEMLFWASRHTGDKSYYDIAVRHADNTLANHFREDNSSYHVISYNNDGTVESKGTFQGFADDSSWARGQAWGLYGYTMSYRETGLERYLEHAQKIAELIMNHPNTPEDRIPYWDYNAPNIPDAPRDTSAAAVMASALFELSTMVEGELSQRYFDYGETLLMALSSDAYLAKKGENGGFILMHATGHLPANSEIDVPLNYGDYYYLEAIRRYLGLRGIDPLTL
ncbi:DUF4995 domain-containing protein [uncultured Alistipes sp.]|uniref:DUF4995 domain-containing protein n=1 Tax=uncultured Alistipes sp. TaxID=538949 RepID=UPI0025EBF67D|nr:DUF4995 domain-containing protein [uncultured Alistipes sp.]